VRDGCIGICIVWICLIYRFRQRWQYIHTFHSRSVNIWQYFTEQSSNTHPITWALLVQAGLTVLMASAVVVLKHETETSTLCQSHNFISIDLTSGVSDYVKKVTCLTEFGSDPMSGRDATWGQHIRVLWLFKLFFVFFILQQSYSPYP